MPRVRRKPINWSRRLFSCIRPCGWPHGRADRTAGLEDARAPDILNGNGKRIPGHSRSLYKMGITSLHY